MTETTTSVTEQQAPPHIPTTEGLLAAASVRHSAVEGTNLTDRLGLMGVCSVFPEYAAIGDQIQLLITTAHGIDHVYDEGDHYMRSIPGPTNIQNLNKLYRELYETYSNQPQYEELLENTLGFLFQAATVEKAARLTSIDPLDPTEYRELMNAIYVRMVVSFANTLVNPDQPVDVIGSNCRDLKAEELAREYAGFIDGKGLELIPQGVRSHALFLWTMIIQQQFDKCAATVNQRKGIPGMVGVDGTTYTERAIEAGIRPSAIKGAGIAIGSLLSLKKLAIHTLPRYRNEKTLAK